MRIVFLLFLTIYTHISYAQQQQIQGVLKTQGGQVIPFASVMIKDSQNKIITFKSSDAEGAFILHIPLAQSEKELSLEINHLGFKKHTIALQKSKSYYEVVLEEQAIDLADVEVRSRPRLTSLGDTLSYDVGSFAKNKDRSIEDVIRRMPGIEVSDEGKITFNGQDISNLYIDGDDLLDDNYAIGTKTIPYAMIKGVEVLQNHQPLKVLKDKSISEKIAINLVIKEEAKLKLTGQAKLGIGLPKQYDSEVNTILFNRKYKMLNVLKGNNVGNDLSSDFTGFNLASSLSGMGNPRPTNLLSSSTAGAPNLPKNRYFLNNSGSLNANNLVNYKNGLQVKSNVKFLADKNEMVYNNLSEYYSNQDTIRYSERQDIENLPFISDLSFHAQVNKDTYYLNNSLTFTYSKKNSNSALLSNQMDLNQKLLNEVRDFSNSLDYVPELRNKNIISFNWYLNYYNSPQTLTIQPGINSEIFNDGDPFNALNQFVEIPTWFNRASLGYRFTRGIIMQNYRIGTLNEFQKLSTQLRLKQLDDSETNYNASDDNHLRWNRNQLYIDGSYEFKIEGLEASLSIPLTWQRIVYKDDTFALEESSHRLLINPSLRVKQMTSVEDYLSFNYRYSNHTGSINNVFRGAVLSNYRSLTANDAQLEEQSSHQIVLNYNFRRSINMFFMNAGLSYNKASSNTITSLKVSDNISQTVSLPMPNNISSLGGNIGASKYIFSLGATAELKVFWNKTRFNQVFNGDLLPFNNRSFQLSQNVEARLWNRISVTYLGNSNWTISKQLTNEEGIAISQRKIQSLDQSIGLSYSPFRNSFIRISGKHQYIRQPQSKEVNYFFIDANARHRINRWHTDIELDLSNLANVISYNTYSLTANHFVFNQYLLRGRMAVLKILITI